MHLFERAYGLLSQTLVMLNLLIVEDDSDATEAMRHAFVEAGYLVTRAVDAREALDRLSLEPVGLVVIDLALPGIDGVQLLGALRAEPRIAQLPVVVHTALPLTPQLRGRLSGADVVLEKNGHSEDLLHAAELALNGRDGAGAPVQ